jgi:signal transduction histidine kinase
MTLRAKLLISFITLGAIPLMAVGWMSGRRNLQAVQDLIAGETRLVADRVSEEVGSRYEIIFGELLFLAENAETLRLYGEDPIRGFDQHREPPESFLSTLWGSLESGYRWVQFRDRDGQNVFRLSAAARQGEGSPMDSPDSFQDDPSRPSRISAQFQISSDILSADGNRVLGSVSAAVTYASVLPATMADRGFGEDGVVGLLDMGTGRVLHYSQRQFLHQPLTQVIPLGRIELEESLRRRTPLEFSRDEQEWIGSLSPVRNTSWAVLSASPIEGFAGPFLDAARSNLLLVICITAIAAAAFLAFTLRTTRSLTELSNAALRVSGGHLQPELPPEGKDEVGVLSKTFRTMLGRIESMIRQVEESRQLAAVGEFSAQIAHEIRNPLTAIRMSLQGLHRKLGRTEHGPSLEIALRETDRLDRVAKGVLSLGRRPEGKMVRLPVSSLASGAVQVLASEMRANRVECTLRDEASGTYVEADDEAVRGAIINLLRNSMEAMKDGGKIEILLDAADRDSVGIHIRDDGAGIPVEMSEKIFDPFVTTKERGNGFGLPLALRAVEASGGSLVHLKSSQTRGAHFMIVLPTVPAETPAKDAGGEG